MYTIVTQEIADGTVVQAINTLRGANANAGGVPVAGGNYVLTANNVEPNTQTFGTGNPEVRTLVIIGHGSANGVSGRATWTTYRQNLPVGVAIEAPQRIYIVSCGTAGQGNQLAYRNFADSVAVAFPQAIVWASSTNVSSTTMQGNWARVDNLPR